jgi:hypothetical protein
MSLIAWFFVALIQDLPDIPRSLSPLSAITLPINTSFAITRQRTSTHPALHAVADTSTVRADSSSHISLSTPYSADVNPSG